MSVHLQKIRVTHTTSTRKDAGTDARVDLRLFIDPNALQTYPNNGWRDFTLDSSRDDRQRGATETYEIDFTTGRIGASVSGVAVPRGVAFPSFMHARAAVMFLKIYGADWWQAQNYRVEGLFQEMRYVAGTIDSFQVVDHGWLLMAERNAPLDMSTDASEGVTWHHVVIDGALPA
jgi:hypothetical protein